MGNSVLVSTFRQVIKAFRHICCTEADNGSIFIVVAAVMVLFRLFQQKTPLPVMSHRQPAVDGNVKRGVYLRAARFGDIALEHKLSLLHVRIRLAAALNAAYDLKHTVGKRIVVV